jgi:hypothetical protein
MHIGIKSATPMIFLAPTGGDMEFMNLFDRELPDR